MHLDTREPGHAVWAYHVASGYTLLVTAYRPDPSRWDAEFKKRVT